MTVEEHLRSQDWGRVRAQVATFAFNHTGKRSWDHAQDLAQQAIADAFARIDGWDPEKEPLLKNLCRRVYGLASNSWRRKGNRFEITMRAALRAHGVSHDEGRRELDVASGQDATDETLHRRRVAESYRQRLEQRLAGDDAALTVVALLKDGVDSPPAQAGASGLTHAQIRDARRRVFRHAETVSKELARELDFEDAFEPSMIQKNEAVQ